MDARNLGWDASERSATGTAGFGIPGFELTGRPAKPKQDTMFLGFFRLRREDWILKQARETRDAGQRTACQSLDKEPAMQPVLVHAARARLSVRARCMTRATSAGAHICEIRIHHHGMVKNSALVIMAQSKSRSAWTGSLERDFRKALAWVASSLSGRRS